MSNQAQHKAGQNRQAGLLRRLCEDTRGNALILTAAAIIPLAGLIGGGVDVARGYAIKTRLQNACDAGALAARRAMTTSTLTAANVSEGTKYFDFNFDEGMFGVPKSKVTRNFVAGGTPGTVVGTATAIMDFTVMKVFNVAPVTMSVDCTATVNVPNTDVMFVLDVTGSMLNSAGSDSGSKLEGLQLAVKDFFKALGPGTQSGAGRIRYGFVPYSSTVNAGAMLKSLSSSYIRGGTAGETAAYTTRTPVTVDRYDLTGWTPETAHVSYGTPSNGTPSNPGWTNYTPSNTTAKTTINGTAYNNYFTKIDLTTCNNKPKPASSTPVGGTVSAPVYISTDADPSYPSTQRKKYYQTTQTMTYREYGYAHTATTANSTKPGTCQFRWRDRTYTRTAYLYTTQDAIWTPVPELTGWNYQVTNVDVSPFVQASNGTAPNPAYWNGDFNGGVNDAPGGNGGSSATATWGGCIEEADTVNTITSSTVGNSIPAGAHDLNIDLIPDEAAEKWRPYIPQMVYKVWSSSDVWWFGNSALQGSGYGVCPSPVSKLRSYANDVEGDGVSTSFKAYVDSLIAVGGTYHDIGLIWGSRMLSPSGILASENADSTAPGGFQVSRHLVFMTDGMLDNRPYAYDAWGVNDAMGRVNPTSTSETSLEGTHEKRTAMICEAAKQKGFVVWVIGFGISSLGTTLTNCATDAEHAAVASNSTALRNKFKDIASTIGGLRLSQ